MQYSDTRFDGEVRGLMKKVCEECSMQFKDNAELGIHLRQYHKKPYCGTCKKEFTNESEFRDHLKSIHGLTSNAPA